MNFIKIANTPVPILDLIKKRWSPRAFSDQPVEPEKLERLFEAARWAASSMNEQPWRFIVGERAKGDTYDRLLSTLNDGNRVWSRNAPVLFLIAGKKTFSRNERANAYFTYDCGQAAAFLSLQAIQENIYIHQMAGFDQGQAKQLFSIPEDYEPLVVCAAGYLGDPQTLSESNRLSETAARSRKPLNDLVFYGDWGITL